MSQQPKPIPKKYSDLISEIEKGKIKIPKFQRNFVWSLDKTAQLLESILKGYPIGTFILWETSEGLNSAKNIGESEFKQVPDGMKVEYVLDGQQRITSLYAAYQGAKIQKEGEKKITDYSEIYVNLDRDLEDNDEHIVVSEKPEGAESESWITLHKLLQFNRYYKEIANSYSGTQVQKIHQYSSAFSNYDFSTVVLLKDDIDSAIEVFTRINTGGQTLTLFEIMSAKTYDEGQNFDMEHKFQKLLEGWEKREYETISSMVILNLLSLVLRKECKRKVILQLKKQEIIDKWDEVISAIESSIDYFRSVYHIRASSILPYDSLIIPFAYYIYKQKGQQPEGKHAEMLKEFFWRMSLSHRYSASTESKFPQDIKRIDEIRDGNRPNYDDIKIYFTADDLINTDFSTGNSYCKAILCLLAAQKPTDFNNSEKEVALDNSWLKVANSKNYHHFFPKAYLKRSEIGKANSIVNITLVSEYSNKGEIRDKAPSEYIQEYLDKNSKLPESIKSHLIDDIEGFGIMTDDYDLFLQKRAEAIHRELKKKIEIEV